MLQACLEEDDQLQDGRRQSEESWSSHSEAWRPKQKTEDSGGTLSTIYLPGTYLTTLNNNNNNDNNSNRGSSRYWWLRPYSHMLPAAWREWCGRSNMLAFHIYIAYFSRRLNGHVSHSAQLKYHYKSAQHVCLSSTAFWLVLKKKFQAWWTNWKICLQPRSVSSWIKLN